MKLTLFAAALLGLTAVRAVELNQGYDHAVYQLAQIDSNTVGDSHSNAAGETKTESKAEVHATT